jgi:hypothetical protein
MANDNKRDEALAELNHTVASTAVTAWGMGYDAAINVLRAFGGQEVAAQLLERGKSWVQPKISDMPGVM